VQYAHCTHNSVHSIARLRNLSYTHCGNFKKMIICEISVINLDEYCNIWNIIILCNYLYTTRLIARAHLRREAQWRKEGQITAYENLMMVVNKT
jgi:hypothetical protein